MRKADAPADREHPYGHGKVESLAATIEGMLILAGAGVIVYEATHRLVVGTEVDNLGVGIAVMGVSLLANLVVSALLGRQARHHQSLALADRPGAGRQPLPGPVDTRPPGIRRRAAGSPPRRGRPRRR